MTETFVEPQVAAPPPVEAPVAATPDVSGLDAALLAYGQSPDAPPAPPAAADPSAAAPTTQAPDYGAWLKENFGADSPDTVKQWQTAAQEAETLRANQVTAEQRALLQLAEKPEELVAYLQEQSRDYAAQAATDPISVLLTAFQKENPSLSAAQAEAMFKYQHRDLLNEYQLALDNPEDADYQGAKQVAEAMALTKVPALTAAQQQMREKLQSAVTAGQAPQAQQQQVIAAYQKEAADWFTASAPKTIPVPVGGGVSVPVEVPNDAAMLAGMQEPWDALLAGVTSTDGAVDREALHQRLAFALHGPAIVEKAVAAALARQPASIPLDRLNNPVPAAAPAVVNNAGKTLDEALAQAAAAVGGF